jgi:lipoprotein signal peptidase
VQRRGKKASKWVRKRMGFRRGEHGADRHPGRRASDHEPLHGWVPALRIAVCIAVVDWLIKAGINATMAIGDFREVVEGRVALWHIRNDAMMLGLWGDLSLDARRGVAVVGALVGALALMEVLGRAHRLPRGHRTWAFIFVGLVLGGMAGNLGERALHWGVTDYLSFRWGDYWLPPGNLADIALFLSMPVAMGVAVFELRARARRGTGRPHGFAATAAETSAGD